MTLVAFDFDGALSESDQSVLLGEEYGVSDEIRGLTDQGLRGETDFENTLRQRVSLLEGMPERQVETAFERCTLRDGAAELVADLRRSGVAVAVVTGGFERGVETALDGADVAVDYLVANRLAMENTAIAGDIEGPLVDGSKDRALEETVASEGTGLDRTIAVGSGVTDLPMLQVAGTAVGFDPVPVVEDHCDDVVTSLRKLRLYFEQHDVVDAEWAGR